MTDARVIADHWARGDVYGLAASVDLADRLPVKAGHHLVDIGCGLGGPARYVAKRFQCQVRLICRKPR